MKKLFLFLFASMLLCQCACVLSQIPPQNIYLGSGCTVALPDYKPYTTVVGSCDGVTLIQTPVAGTIYTNTTKTVSVVLKATTGAGKILQTSFVVNVNDTITPHFVFTGPLALQQIDSLRIKAEELYNIADNMAVELYKEADKLTPGSGPYSEGYYDSTLIITVSKRDSLLTGWHRFQTTGDLVQINPDTSINTGSIEWNNILNKPTEFTPATHTHSFNSLTDQPNFWTIFTDFDYVPVASYTTSAASSITSYGTIVPLIFDTTLGKMKFLYGGTWHTITSN
jgi:hypothetical protein